MSKIAVVYWSGTGNTETMANAVVEGAKSSGNEVDLFFSDDFNSSMVDDYSSIAFGCPAMGDEVLEESSFEPMFESLESNLNDKKIAIFGSYEWNNGEWMVDWEKRVLNDNAILTYKPLAVYDTPTDKVDPLRVLAFVFVFCPLTGNPSRVNLLQLSILRGAAKAPFFIFWEGWIRPIRGRFLFKMKTFHSTRKMSLLFSDKIGRAHV